MKLARFIGGDGCEHTGRLTDEPQQAYPLVGALLGQFHFLSEPVAIRRLLPPVQPPNVYAIGRNYAGHVQETGARPPERPLVFMKATTSVIGPHEPIVLPAAAPTQVDYEAELAIVIGRRARHVPETKVDAYVLGYTCANDISARDCQAADKQWTRAKSFDTFCPLGPWLVTGDELDPDRCTVRSRLNGQVMQEASTGEMTFASRWLVSYLSHQFTLLPGTVILTGTPAGVGFTRQPAVFLRAGDRIEVEISGIGTLANPVTDAPPDE